MTAAGSGGFVPNPRPADGSCRYGFTENDLDQLLGARRPEFDRWMRGQTQAICDGRTFDYGANSYVPSGCGPHGVISYGSDVRRFLSGGPIVD